MVSKGGAEVQRWRLSLRTAIAVPFAALFIGTVALQAVTQHRQIDALIDQESVRLLDAVTHTASDRLLHFLATPFRVQRSVADAIGRHGLYHAGDLRPIHEYLRAILDAIYADERQIGLLGFGGREGEYAGIRREDDGRLRLILQDRSTHGRLQVYGLGSSNSVIASQEDYDPRGRPWYAPVAASGQARWSEIYTSAGERGDVMIAASSPVVSDGEPVGVVQAEVRLDTLQRFLGNEPLLGHGHIFVIDAEDRLVAQSGEGSVTLPMAPGSRQYGRRLASQSTSEAVRAAARFLPAGTQDEGAAAFSYPLDGQRYFARVTPFTQVPGLNWRIVVALPEADLLGDTRAASRRLLLATAAIAAFGLLLGLWAIQRIAAPILLTARAAQRMARGDWDTELRITSPLRETGALVQAFNDMAGRLRHSFEQLHRQLLGDPLTGLLTRRGLLEKADWPHPRRAVLVLAGIDAFRAVNDSMGLDTGDRLLQAAADRMRGSLPAPAFAARLGGDEFALLYLASEAAPPADAGRAIQDVFAQPFSVGEDEVQLTVSVGTVSGTLPAGRLADWLRNASSALGEAKRMGRGQCVPFTPDMMERSLERVRLASELRQALEREQFVLHYQPVVELSSGRTIGAEALVRWESPTRGLVPPGVFIPVAEASDLILGLGEWVLREATHAIAGQLPQLPDGFDIHVNVSARQLIQSDFQDTLKQILQDSGLPPGHLTLELTESVLLEDDGVTRARLAAIRALGVKIAIDDFGTGYSSLAYLGRLPFDCLKVDQRFVRNLLHSPQDEAIVNAVLSMARGFAVTVVAEGVETAEEADRLRSMGCASAQGYHFGRPAPLEHLRLATPL
ncbi:sensor domain-containing phosphodiesterase [Paracidovorax avenae]|uniref:bifunctional diguanylate cyclase/phosphodiesterase n=1 Tax=Paracidovorax avenae TaxID=80867 RepID=UPI000D162500|nr:GGDEF and EAL domain-containing protein [Paracidovorax avenae]AVS78819.1 sensor domain-containing phosphodiesterase [Paracidovorax avenae]AVT07045.1 sensor domain-containing phosphodiesterase [Paracidovorax avenae]AVT21524.1 sensor domain-containing phosphodiesterase [Paracidovorax avenae]